MSTVESLSLPAGMGPLQLLAWWRQNKDQLLQLGSLYDEYKSIKDPPDSDAGFKARLTVALKAAAMLATLSGNAQAEQVVDTITKILANDALLSVIEKLAVPLLKPAPATPATPATDKPAGTFTTLSTEHQATFSAQGIDWLKLVEELLPLVVEVAKDLAAAA